MNARYLDETRGNLRMAFAALAMHALIPMHRCIEGAHAPNGRAAVEDAVKFADALLAALEVKP